MAKKKNTRILFIILGLVFFIVLLIGGKKAGWWGGEEGIQIEVEEVKKRTLTETVSASGKLKPAMEVMISPDVSGEIIELPVKEGDKIKKGDLLARIRPDNYQAALERARAALNNMKANLENSRSQLTQAEAQFSNSKKTFERNKGLHEKNAISDSEFERIEADYKIKSAQVEAARQMVNASIFNVKSSEATLRDAQDNLAKTTIYAPVDGTISSLDVELGERVVGTMQMKGTEMMILADLSEMEVEVEVNENDIINIEYGDTAYIEIDAFVNEKFRGIVTEISNSAKNSSQSGMSTTEQATNFPVTIRILKTSYSALVDSSRKVATPFRPGMSAIVEIITERKENILTVPILAVTTRKSDDSLKVNKKPGADIVEVVFVYEEGKARKKPVEIGIQDDYYIEIMKGIEEGESVISGPYSIVSKTLKDDMHVSKGE